MAGVGLFAISVYSNLMFFRKVRRYEALRTDSKAVEMFEVSADRILDVEPVGDNGPAFCFFVGGRKTLLLVGQWLLRYDSFPSKSFCLHLWSETRVPIRIDAIGPTVEPEHCDVQLRPTHRLRQLALFEASPETLQADLDNALGIARQGIGRS